MERIIPVIKELEAAMDVEAQKLDIMAETEKSLYKRLLDREWSGIDEDVGKIRTLSGEVSAWGEKRLLLYQDARKKSGVPEEAGFEDFLARLPAGHRGGLEERRRKLRLAAERIRGITEGIDVYVRFTRNSTERVLEEFFPSRRLRTYTRTGETQGIAQAQMVSHSL